MGQAEFEESGEQTNEQVLLASGTLCGAAVVLRCGRSGKCLVSNFGIQKLQSSGRHEAKKKCHEIGIFFAP